MTRSPQDESTDDLASKTDEELFVRLKNREAAVLALLFRRYGHLVYGQACSILKNPQEAEDLTQDIFVELWRNASKNTSCRYFIAYLTTMTRSRAIDKLRSRSRHLKLVEKSGLNSLTQLSAPTPIERAAATERRRQIRTALTQLPQKQCQVIEMAYDQGYSQTEIARRLNLPLGTVKTCTRQGLLKLRQILLNQDSMIHE
ncbi:sigma-70 family RNA polymerase sigma factor [Gloeobacter morelensis]|uniref:Sigma-70 family RNA polymerase sigma factor n=1 Tax=Gloeobacter morelensis MG652769 TaxID=2781736 RepID=A0ABY3PQR1_9CYAN|nr:sigma-70 family RNA polymerase sigma factor [Gloeobacter morelensis]UFP96032.1 sigma-70 family RNA polymerase sigma factor [Gloeobacter morelensis MG652769]